MGRCWGELLGTGETGVAKKWGVLAGRGSGGMGKCWGELLGNGGGEEMGGTGKQGQILRGGSSGHWRCSCWGRSQVLGGLPVYWGAIAGCWGA